MSALVQSGKPKQVAYVAAPIPSGWIEYAYYFTLFYSMLAPGLGLEIPFVAAGALFSLTFICVWQLRSCLRKVFGPISSLLGCAAIFVLIQVIVHDEPFLGENVRRFTTGIFTLILIYSLCLRRGFYLRLPAVLFAFGAMSLPFLIYNPGDAEMARVDAAVVQGSLSHPGGLGEWFGFCAIYFAILGLETNRFSFRLGAWVLAVGSLLVVTWSVERGPIFGAALGITVAFRSLLKRGFMPLLLLIMLAGVLSVTGVFDKALSKYSGRGMEQTGREKLWPEAIERISSSPIAGVGFSKVGTPHNSFLYFAVASGFIPAMLWLAFWIQAARNSISGRKGGEGNSFRLPYLLFTFVTAMLSDTGYMQIWALFALSIAAGASVLYDTMRLLVIRAGDKIKIQFLPRVRSPESTTPARYGS